MSLRDTLFSAKYWLNPGYIPRLTVTGTQSIKMNKQHLVSSFRSMCTCLVKNELSHSHKKNCPRGF